MTDRTITDDELANLSGAPRRQVGGLPDQDWSLRVTQVYRHDGSDWRVVHRHADPLVRPIDLEKASALIRG